MGTEARQVEFLMSGANLADGSPCDSGKVYFLAVNTSTAKTVYKAKTKSGNTYDMTTGTASDPIEQDYVLLDSGGRPAAGEVFADGTYDVKIYDQNDNLIDTFDDMTWEVPASTSSITTAVVTSTFTPSNTGTVPSVDRYYCSNSATGTFDIGPDELDAGSRYTFINTDASTITINPEGGGDTIAGLSTLTLTTKYETLTLETPGSGGDWFVVQGSGPSNIPRIPDFTNGQHDHTNTAGGGTLVSVPIGGIIMRAIETVPSGWLECNGGPVSRTTYSELFNVIGTIYGDGDTSSTFDLPDLRGQFIRGRDNSAGIDPDAATRLKTSLYGTVDSGSQLTGDNVGTVQAYTIKGHTHQTRYSSGNLGGLGGSGSYLPIGTAETETVTGGSATVSTDESRPQNVAMMFIIRTGESS